jgi:NADH-quinone oxidoreductase subunit L
MKAAMAGLALLAILGGIPQIPDVNESLHKFLEPTFADSRYYDSVSPSGTLTIVGLIVGAVMALTGIFIAYTLWVRKPEVPARMQARLAPLHTFFVNKWYFDEAIDVVFVRPATWVGRFASTTFERVFVQGALVGGAAGLVGLAGAAVRRVQTGYLRYYAALLLLGITSLGAYFLVSA